LTYQVIPRSVLENAKGFAIFTVFKAGFLFSARAGTGIVIAKLDDGCGHFAYYVCISTAHRTY
jgi:lipid-binding SYLF domain-containing protein